MFPYRPTTHRYARLHWRGNEDEELQKTSNLQTWFGDIVSGIGDIFGPNRWLKIKTTSQKAYCRNWELGLLTVGTGDYKIQNGGQLNINSKTERNIIFMELM